MAARATGPLVVSDRDPRYFTVADTALDLMPDGSEKRKRRSTRGGG